MTLRPRKNFEVVEAKGFEAKGSAASAPPLDGPHLSASADDRMGPLRAIGWLFAFGLLSGGLLLGALLYRFLTPAEAPAAVTEELVRGEAMVAAIRDLARLETASFHMERVIDLQQRQRTLFGLVESTDAILLVAAAEVEAGVDLTEMRDGDVVVDLEARTAVITLPPPQIFSARLDNERTYVHTRRTDTLAARSEQLETRARREAERSLREAAIAAGILERARDNARASVTTLVRALGYDRVEVRFADHHPTRDERIGPAPPP